MYITPEQKEILGIIKEKSDNKTLIVSGDFELSLLSAIYSKAWPWISNPYTTPFYKEKKAAYTNFITTGKTEKKWLGRKIIFIFNKKDSLENMAAARTNNASLLKETPTYKLFITEALTGK